MLELRPNCENCDTDLAPNSTEARVCSFECTFCAPCADGALEGVCPNCGGNLVPRPIRPRAALGKFPASTERLHKAVDQEKHQAFAAKQNQTEPENR